MYKKIMIIMALALISACSGNTKDDALMASAEANYKEAGTLVSKAKAYKLDMSEADKKLLEAKTFITDEKYNDSISSSNAAKNIAANAISKYESAQVDMKTSKALEAKMLAKRELDEQNSLAKEAAGQSYIVKHGDNLWNIAAANKQLNFDPLLWPRVFADNEAQIKDADLLYPNMVLQIKAPKQETLSNNARKHAKTRGPWSLGKREAADERYLKQQ